jgi:integrase
MSIEKTAQGKRRVRWRDSNGDSRARVFPTLREAQQFQASIITAKARGTVPDYRAGNVPLREHAETWLASLHVRDSTLRTYRSRLDAVILPRLGDRRLSQVRRVDVQKVITEMRRDRASSSASIRGVYAVLALVFTDAVDSEMLAVSPCRNISLPPKTARPVQPLTSREVVRMADALPERYRVLAWIGIGTGARLGECLGLQLSDIDWLRRTIRIERQMTARGQLAELKTAASKRTIPVDSMILERISEVLQPGCNDHELLLRVGRTPFAKAWRRACEQAGLHAGTRFHDLRHTYASALIASGMNVKIIQQRLGHSSAMITLDVYGHLFPDDADLGRGVIEGLFAASGAEAGAGAGTH